MAESATLKDRIALADSLCKLGAQKILETFSENVSIHKKGPQEDLVTQVDEDIERSYRKKIIEKFPNDSIFGEEEKPLHGSSPYSWYFDPLDGTHNFLLRFPFCGTQVAVVKESQTVYSRLSLPLLAIEYVAERGKGAFVIRSGKKEKLQVSTRSLEESAFLCSMSIQKYPEARYFLDQLLPVVGEVRLIGATMVELGYLASGVGDIRVSHRSNPHDYAAGSLLVLEAGGMVTDLGGKPWTVNSQSFLASNGLFHDQLLDILQEN